MEEMEAPRVCERDLPWRLIGADGCDAVLVPVVVL